MRRWRINWRTVLYITPSITRFGIKHWFVALLPLAMPIARCLFRQTFMLPMCLTRECGTELNSKSKSQPRRMPQAIFEKCVDEVLIPAVNATRNLDERTNKLAILFCDNCSAHCSEDVLKKLTRRDIFVMTYPPHESHLFQVVDALLFGILKRAKKYPCRDETFSK
jgi:hypothetical protein